MSRILSKTFPVRRAWLGLFGAITLAATLAACGGGGGAAADDSGQTGGTNPVSFTSGAISGFGSIIVNGVRFDDSTAKVLDDNGHAIGHDSLKLGSQVEIEGGSIDRGNGRAKALTIRIGSELLGSVTAVDSAASTLALLGQTVEVTATTAFDDSLPGGLSAVAVGDVLEVHAQLDTARGVYVASRIEPATGVTSFKLRGVVAALDTTAKTFQVGNAVINYAQVAQVPGNLANGAWLKMRLQPVQVAGQWVATALDNGQRRHGEDESEAEFKGFITAWTSATQFSVDGQPVDASQASFPDGQSGVVLGARVEVEGAIVNGVLMATKVHTEDESHDGQGEDFELHGTLSALDTVNKTFSLRGVLVDYSAVSSWKDLSEASLANDLKIEVKGSWSADRTRLVASRISRED